MENEASSELPPPSPAVAQSNPGTRGELLDEFYDVYAASVRNLGTLLTERPALNVGGTLLTDPTIVDADGHLVAAYDGPEDLFAGELHHRREHSIEFQALWLQHLFGGRRTRGGNSWKR